MPGSFPPLLLDDWRCDPMVVKCSRRSCSHWPTFFSQTSRTKSPFKLAFPILIFAIFEHFTGARSNGFAQPAAHMDGLRAEQTSGSGRTSQRREMSRSGDAQFAEETTTCIPLLLFVEAPHSNQSRWLPGECTWDVGWAMVMLVGDRYHEIRSQQKGAGRALSPATE